MEAVKYFDSGYSCSESIVMEAVDMQLCDKSLLPVATPFSGGMGSGCLCGAVSGAQMVIGVLFGKNNKFGNEPKARQLAKEFVDKFKSKHKATCCKVLSREFEFSSPERREHCKLLVEDCSKILKDIVACERV